MRKWLPWRPLAHSPPGAPRSGQVNAGGDGGEGVAHRHELRRRLGHLGLGVGPRDDAAAGEQPDPRRVVASTPHRSAARCPTRRRRWRRSSRPARRSARGPCARARLITASATGVGVPHTAADGCSDAARVSDDASSTSTPATSVARCMTFDRCSTNGASGTFIDEQCRASASATERTAYSCSSRSFDERASEAASARSCSSSPVRRIVPASTREVTRPFSQPHEQLRRRTDEPVDGEHPRRGVLLREPVQQPAHVERCPGRHVEVARQHDLVEPPGVIRETASATAPAHSAEDSAPSANATSTRRARRAPAARSTACPARPPRPEPTPRHGRQPGRPRRASPRRPRARPASHRLPSPRRTTPTRTPPARCPDGRPRRAPRRCPPGPSTTTRARPSDRARMPCGSPHDPTRRCPRHGAPTSTRRSASPGGTSASRAAPSSGSSGTVRETRGAAGESIASIGGSPAGSEVIAQQDTTRARRR